MKVLSPVPRGSGAYVLHAQLARRLPGYWLNPYSPWWTLIPPALAAFSSSKVDLLHASADYGIFVKRPGVPLIATLHNYTSDRFMRPYSSRLQYLHYRTDLRCFTRRTLDAASVVVAISRFVADLVTDDLASDKRIHLIYNGVDHGRFVPDSRDRGQPQKSARFRVLYCGNLNRRKRAELLPALSERLGGRFEIHYTAGLSQSGQRFADAGSNAAALRPLGRVEHTHMPGVYQSMDVLFMPSVREGFGLCVAEAMACGLPVVACGESALPELVVQGEGGFLCPVDDVACYADAIRTLAEDRQAARRMGEFNRARVERMFTLDRMVRDYRELFESVLDGAVTD
jgi:glycosyltransferase involved in cell wall biosynthesis